jgi:hypothetical protein
MCCFSAAGYQREKKEYHLTKLIPWLMLLTAVGVWAIASVFGESLRLSKLVSNMSLALTMVSVLLIGATMGGQAQLVASIRSTHAMIWMASWFTSDWFRALILLVLPELGLAFLALSFLNQCCRRCFVGLAKPFDDEADKARWLTTRVVAQLRTIARWDRSSVFLKSVWLSFWIWTFSVVFGRLTSIFLNWLRQQLLSVSLFTTTAVYMVSGLLMFLLPPVPVRAQAVPTTLHFQGGFNQSPRQLILI